MPEMNFIRSLLEQATAQGSRSTALKPLGWLLALLLSSTLGCFSLKAPIWASVLLGVLSTIAVIVYVGAYVFLLVKNPDALRSERFFLQKLAIEKGLYGDSLVGTLELPGDRLLSAVDEANAAKEQPMKARFIVAVDRPTAEQTRAISDLFRARYGWWHWIDGFWLLTDSTGTLNVSTIRDLLDQAAPSKRNLVIQVEHQAWAGFGPAGPKSDMFEWIRKNWEK